MRNLFILIVILLPISSFSQEDTTFTEKIKVIDEVTINFQTSTIFDKENQYLIDFHIDSFGNYILLKNGNHYILSRMDASFNLSSNLLLDFKPIGFHRNCMSELHVLSKDSVYKVEEQLPEIEIYYPNTVAFYEGYFQKCQLETQNHLVYKHLFRSNQVAGFLSVNKEDSEKSPFYYAYDSVQVVNSREWEHVLMRDGINPFNQQQFGISLILIEREKFQHYTYYHQIVSKEDYIPIFQNHNRLHLFDHYKDSLVVFDDTSFQIEDRKPISFHKLRGWQKQILLDQVTNKYYTLYNNEGGLFVTSLSSDDFSILQSRKVQESILTKRFMIHNGFLYYDTKKDFESSFNELRRQRL